jgi:uncharacterized protein YgbK (DUF1537 family)
MYHGRTFSWVVVNNSSLLTQVLWVPVTQAPASRRPRLRACPAATPEAVLPRGSASRQTSQRRIALHHADTYTCKYTSNGSFSYPRKRPVLNSFFHRVFTLTQHIQNCWTAYMWKQAKHTILATDIQLSCQFTCASKYVYSRLYTHPKCGRMVTGNRERRELQEHATIASPLVTGGESLTVGLWTVSHVLTRTGNRA